MTSDRQTDRTPQKFRPQWFRGTLVRRVLIGQPFHYWRIGESEYYAWPINNHAEAEGHVSNLAPSGLVPRIREGFDATE